MKKSIIPSLVILALIIGGIVYFLGKQKSFTTNESSQSQSSIQNSSSSESSKGGSKEVSTTSTEPQLSAKEYLEKAKSFYQERKMDEALNYIKLSISKSESAEAYNLWGNILRDQGLISEAREKYKKAISLDSHLISAYLNLSAIYQDENNLKEAEEILKQGLNANPNNLDLQNALGFLKLTPTSGE